MIVDHIYETKGYLGLYGEVVTADCYRLKQITWQPDIIFDLGANIGVFARFARTLFPHARIFSVEPDPENCIHFQKFTRDENIFLIERAIGKGQMWHALGAANGAMQCYLSEGTGYPLEELASWKGVEMVDIKTITVQELVRVNRFPGCRSILKMDIEGNEQMVFSDPHAMEAIGTIDYIAIELHKYAATGELYPKVVREMETALASLSDTHDCEMQPNYFFATKKPT